LESRELNYKYNYDLKKKQKKPKFNTVIRHHIHLPMIYDAYNAILNDVIKKKIIIAGFYKK